MSFYKNIDRFDMAVGGAVIVLMLALGVTVAMGDRAGIGIIEKMPQTQAHTTTTLRITFDEPMDTASVEAALSIDPPITGKFTWNGPQITFKPEIAWKANTDYTVTIRAGAHSTQSRRLIDDLRWTFHVAPSRVLYLAPAVTDRTAALTNLWMVDPAVPFKPTQLTHAQHGIDVYFEASPDGTQIAFAQKADDGTTDLYLLTVDSGEVQRLTHCIAATCTAPAWSPDSSRIAYQRIEMNSNNTPTNQDAPRTWLLNLKDLSTQPLFPTSQVLGGLPRWSPDGKQLVMYDRNRGAVAIYNLDSQDRQEIPTQDGDTGVYAFDPTSTKLVFPQLIAMSQGFATEMALADLTKGVISPLSTPDTLVEDDLIAWNPVSKMLTITRRYLDSPDTANAQVYIIDPATTRAQPLIVDANYFHSAINWDATGTQLVIQRLPTTGQSPPGIWVYDALTKKLSQVAQNGYLPQWLP